MEAELIYVEQARNEAQARWERAQAGLADADGTAQKRRDHLASIEKRLAETRLARDEKRESLSQARLELADRRQKVEVLDRGLADMERRRAQMSELLLQRQREIELWTEQCAGLEREAEHLKARSGQITETLVVAQQQVEQVRLQLVEIERSIDGVESSQSQLRHDSDSAHGELGRCEVKLAETRSRAQFIEEDIHREYQIRVGAYDWRSLLWRSEDDPPDLKQLDLDDEEEEEEAGIGSQESGVRSQEPANQEVGAQEASTGEAAPAKRGRPRKPKTKQRAEPTEEDLKGLEQTDWTPIKAEIDALRQRLASMGAVNLVAIEEYADLKQRYDFLKTQSDDLHHAKTDLLMTIDEINQTSMKQFEITFEQIKKNFEFTFQTLFGGGRAHLELVQTEDVMESGIDIIAQPPGTKLKSITLLSGGQKTLTAVALLFALYMVKPSPFCLLDELDAPLDESNIGRFTDLLKRFIHESQFIIITHNKRTVAAAHSIYGVTMEERGVSKTVSMRFNHDDSAVDTTQTANIADAVRGLSSPQKSASSPT
jgi:chromosome segregation protein